jgi:hypothetical protein
VNNSLTPLDKFEMKPALPHLLADLETHCTLVHLHDARDRSILRDGKEEVTVIRHDHECVEEKGIPVLNAIETLHCLPSTGGIGKYLLSILCVSRDEHEMLRLDGVALEHAISIGMRSYKQEIVIGISTIELLIYSMRKGSGPFQRWLELPQ